MLCKHLTFLFFICSSDKPSKSVKHQPRRANSSKVSIVRKKVEISFPYTSCLKQKIARYPSPSMKRPVLDCEKTPDCALSITYRDHDDYVDCLFMRLKIVSRNNAHTHNLKKISENKQISSSSGEIDLTWNIRLFSCGKLLKNYISTIESFHIWKLKKNQIYIHLYTSRYLSDLMYNIEQQQSLR